MRLSVGGKLFYCTVTFNCCNVTFRCCTVHRTKRVFCYIIIFYQYRVAQTYRGVRDFRGVAPRPNGAHNALCYAQPRPIIAAWYAEKCSLDGYDYYVGLKNKACAVNKLKYSNIIVIAVKIKIISLVTDKSWSNVGKPYTG